MTPRERMLAVLNGEEPDKIPVAVFEGVLAQHPGEWSQRLKERGMALMRHAIISEPGMWSPRSARPREDGFRYGLRPDPRFRYGTRPDPRLTDIRYTRTDYFEKGLWKYRQTWETPVGSITNVMIIIPGDYGATIPQTEEYVIKQPSDWRVVNYFIKEVLDNLVPTYEGFETAEEALGDAGITMVFLLATAWQWAWRDLAGPERAVIDFHEQFEEVQEYIELSNRWHTKQAEFAAECPAKFICIAEDIGLMTSPKYYREYCLPIYEIYSKQLAGTGKVLSVYMDGRLGHLRKEIAETPCDVVESFSVPSTGDMTLTEARSIWPDKMIFMNPASHLGWAEPEEVRRFYEALAQEWGSKKGLLLELSEQLPVETVEAHMSAAMDAFGY